MIERLNDNIKYLRTTRKNKIKKKKSIELIRSE